MPDTKHERPKPPLPSGNKLDRAGSVRTTLQVYLPNGEFRAVKYGESSDLKVFSSQQSVCFCHFLLPESR